MTKPTTKFYSLFQHIFDFYNATLFNGQLNDCIIVISRKNNVFGHYAPKRWFSTQDHETDELAINPSMICKHPLKELCQTIVHEMCHGWQFNFGKPSRRTYHNKEWADKMESVGLMPSNTGLPGGKRVGQKMADYSIEDGPFDRSTKELFNGNVFEGLFLEIYPDMVEEINLDEDLFDQIKDMTLSYEGPGKPKKNSTIKYSCGCSNVWGKAGLEISCLKCNTKMKP